MSTHHNWLHGDITSTGEAYSAIGDSLDAPETFRVDLRGVERLLRELRRKHDPQRPRGVRNLVLEVHAPGHDLADPLRYRRARVVLAEVVRSHRDAESLRRKIEGAEHRVYAALWRVEHRLRREAGDQVARAAVEAGILRWRGGGF